MKKKNNTLLVISTSLIILLLIMPLIFTGSKRTDVYLTNYSISSDGKIMTLNVSPSSSIGYIKSLKVKQDRDSKYITFYSTFGLNNSLGSRNTFEIELNPSCKEIYFYKGDDEYMLVLQKNRDTWNSTGKIKKQDITLE